MESAAESVHSKSNINVYLMQKQSNILHLKYRFYFLKLISFCIRIVNHIHVLIVSCLIMWCTRTPTSRKSFVESTVMRGTCSCLHAKVKLYLKILSLVFIFYL